ncbi:hypothetical protein DL766_001611 [Monosporascus sp. MC13-8B]|uniref:Mediator of RNA polymerase II transcription subunit 5 n=1 Tax=Monosporascus cannonballus TaxID=155416 RepID=A0ABY0HIV1_9PEZI|nr:hypothetical protein DL762_000553 [Monosporascus cannonballus]RYP37301.1 hypothetical protein DL766_001611 [Monosporascus sp. MC13-8B]
MEMGMEMEIDMDWGGESGSGDAATTSMQNHSQAIEQWNRFLEQCISSRLDPETFESYVPLLNSKYPLPPAAIADVFLHPQPSNHESLDPRIPRYIHVLTQRRLIDTPSILKALYKYSTSHTQAQKAGHPPLEDAQARTISLRWGSSYSSEEVVFYRLTKTVGLGTGIKSASDALEVCKIIANWMFLFTSASAAFAHDVMGQLQNAQSKDEMEGSRAAFVMLLLSVCENRTVLNALGRPFAKEARKALSESLAVFVPLMLQNAPQIAGRLELFRTETLASFDPIDKKNDPVNAEMDDILDSTVGLDNFVVPELPITNTRAGLYIYLNAALVGRPLIDDNAFFSYLHNRYQFCITEALSQVDTNAFPTLSGMFDESNNNNSFTDTVRQDFCFACCLHGLIPESSIEGLLGEITYQSLPSAGKYVKEALVEECMADPERIQGLVGELDNMDGNVGAVCQALTEVIARLCCNKETMTLKLLCSQLAKKPLSLDVMLLFEKPITILHPLCELLDNWRYEEDQGEYQPVYEEFGSVMLLLLAFVYRYNLSPLDLGIRSPDSFVAKIVHNGQLGRSLDELTDQERGHLDGWIHGLFDTGAGGLGDELMSSCPPQDFYLLVATLFQNIVLAFGTGYLSEESLKTGLEYLVDTFLLPSLVLAISYMANQLWSDISQEKKAVIRVLQLILLTKQGSNEAQSMLTAVVNIVAKPLEHALRLSQRQNPKSQDIEPLLKAIKDNTRFSRRTAGAGHNELEAWTSTANGGLVTSVRHTIQGFVQWSLHPGINIMPTAYTHRQILAALRMLGAKRLLYVILDEVKQQTEAGSGSVVYDVATALICAPDVTNMPPPPEMLAPALHHHAHNHGHHAPPPPPPPPVIPPHTRISLREALKFEAEDFKVIQQRSDATTAEHAVRLYRRVEAQLLPAPPQPTAAEAEAMLQDALGGMNDAFPPDASSAAAAQGGDDSNHHLDLGAGNEMNLGGAGGDPGAGGGPGSSSAGGGLDLGDEDIFGGLGGVGGGADLLNGWDDILQ